MSENTKHYIGGAWVASEGGSTVDVVNPSTEEVCGKVVIGTAADVDRAAKAARSAFESYSRTSTAERVALLERIADTYDKRVPDIAKSLVEELGTPTWLAEQMQAILAGVQLRNAAQVLREYSFTEMRGTTLVVQEPIGVCGFITPWNWPLNMMGVKIAPALAVGCTIVLKPSELTPTCATILAEILHDAKVPAGVFNLVHGDGVATGAALASHPEVDMISFTGSTRAGIEVARAAAPTVKRVHQELGGKSPNIVLRSADLQKAVSEGVSALMVNSGQSCNAPTRMLVPKEKMDEAKRVARATAEDIVPGIPETDPKLGPVVSERQWNNIQALIEKGIAEGATLVTGGPGRPEHLNRGFFVRPTIFADATNDMTIARQEIFGPVLTIIGYGDEAEAVRTANDTPYGLSSYVQGEGAEARAIAARLRAGQVHLNGAMLDFNAPFGGYKQSGNGREYGKYAFPEFLETKAIMGVEAV